MNDTQAIILARSAVASGQARSLLQLSGLTFREHAKACRSSTSTIYRYATGERVPTGATAVRFGRHLGRLIDLCSTALAATAEVTPEPPGEQ